MPRLLILYSANTAVCGVGTWVDSLVSQLPAFGWEVVVGLSQGRQFHRPKLVEQHWPTWSTISMDARTGTAISRQIAVLRTIEKTQPDIVLSTLLDDGLRASSLSCHLKRCTRFAVANHGNAPPHLAAIIEAAAGLDLVVSVNQASYNLLKDWPGLQWNNALVCIPNAVPLPTAKQSASDGCLRLGFVGRLAKDKGTDLLSDIVTELASSTNRFRVTIAGDGPERQHIERLAAGFPELVAYRGPLTRTQLYESVYPNLDVILCCSPSEGWPMSIAEGMVHGAVPVSSEYIGIHQEAVIQDGRTGLIFPCGRSDASIDAIQTLLDPQLRNQLGQSAREMILRNYTLEQFGDRWNAALRGCLLHDPCKRASSSDLPPFSIRQRITEGLRRRLRMRVAHDSARAEWPMMAPRDIGLTKKVATLLQELDSRGVPPNSV
ncbi:MAG: glycosyltransferase family 4 protein [Planctomycetaceae bacterium]|nr:glycosyltransferase family 4 protein [Planctomycetaceae bacterium]